MMIEHECGPSLWFREGVGSNLMANSAYLLAAHPLMANYDLVGSDW